MKFIIPKAKKAWLHISDWWLRASRKAFTIHDPYVSAVTNDGHLQTISTTIACAIT